MDRRDIAGEICIHRGADHATATGAGRAAAATRPDGHLPAAAAAGPLDPAGAGALAGPPQPDQPGADWWA